MGIYGSWLWLSPFIRTFVIASVCFARLVHYLIPIILVSTPKKIGPYTTPLVVLWKDHTFPLWGSPHIPENWTAMLPTELPSLARVVCLGFQGQVLKTLKVKVPPQKNWRLVFPEKKTNGTCRVLSLHVHVAWRFIISWYITGESWQHSEVTCDAAGCSDLSTSLNQHRSLGHHAWMVWLEQALMGFSACFKSPTFVVNVATNSLWK